ncbi:hypothetical protein [Arenicella xantha]|uniref:Uncharacterized protein n=1 Tax=Arenicella xantha TaxID=644221 RepID=A0A395JUI3_9GAMM|nr:hypothetical protein [Arenicella xantha]RBP53208.1 hypothetical protein DFR28_101593 [Arenicella xantha]
MHSESVVYTEALIEQRAHAIGYAIDARRQRFPDETSYRYKPLADKNIQLKWDSDNTMPLRDYNLLDLSI